MAEASAQTYRQCAMARLERAAGMYRAINPESMGTAFCELAQIASLIWDAVIDAVAISYMAVGSTPSGKSTELSQYAKAELPDVYEYWHGPARLHNYQHRPHLGDNAFDFGCQRTAVFLTMLNGYLPEGLRLPAESFDWLPGTE